MLFRTSTLSGCSIQARDGAIGSVSDLLFEDDTWRVRWLIVDTGSWLTGRKVLLPASHLDRVETGASSIPVDLTREQVRESPGLGTDLPVSRQMEANVYSHYGWAPYWGPTAGMAYAPPLTYPLAPSSVATAPNVAPGTGPAIAGAGPYGEEPHGDPHLRSANEVMDYYIHARDGDIGHVEDFVADSDAWTIRYLIVDTRNWWPGKRVLIAPSWIQSIAWADRTVHVDRDRQTIKNAPEYDSSRPIDRDFETRLYRHHGTTAYWADF